MAVVVTCKAAGAWGFVGTIEDAMATQAEAAVQRFTAFVLLWCATHGTPGTANNGDVTSPLANGTVSKLHLI